LCLAQPNLDFLQNKEHYGNDDQGQKRGKNKSVDNGFGQGSPENHVVSTDINVGIVVDKKVKEINIQTNG
jgi:hypothetical protein